MVKGKGKDHAGEEDEIYVDRDGIPHFNRNRRELLVQYRKRVELEYESILEDDRKRTLGVRLLRGLTGRAWREAERIPIADLKTDGGHLRVINALEGLDEEVITKKEERFDNFFRYGYRERNESIPDYIRRKEELHMQMRQIDGATQLSDDLYAYFMLEGAKLGEREKRLIVQTSGND